MRARTVIFGMTLFAGAVGADAPSHTKAPTSETKAAIEAKLESDAKVFGVRVAELKRLRQFGYSDAEIHAQITENGRTPRQLIVEREVVNELAKVLADVNQRVYKMPADEQVTEREKAIRDAVTKIRRERRASREELKQILSRTSFLQDNELKRVAR